jgi:hypothetical protein
VTGSCACRDEPLGSSATELVMKYSITNTVLDSALTA